MRIGLGLDGIWYGAWHVALRWLVAEDIWLSSGVWVCVVPMSGDSVVQYRYVSHPRIRGVSCGWVAQKRSVCYRARFDTQLQAAKWIANLLGVSVASLRIKPVVGVKKKAPAATLKFSKHAGVTYDRGRWIARGAGTELLGRYGTEFEAACAVAAATGVGVKALKKKGLPKYLAKNLFKAAYRVFRKYVPGDYDNMVAHEKLSVKMFQQASLTKQALLDLHLYRVRGGSMTVYV